MCFISRFKLPLSSCWCRYAPTIGWRMLLEWVMSEKGKREAGLHGTETDTCSSVCMKASEQDSSENSMPLSVLALVNIFLSLLKWCFAECRIRPSVAQGHFWLHNQLSICTSMYLCYVYVFDRGSAVCNTSLYDRHNSCLESPCCCSSSLKTPKNHESCGSGCETVGPTHPLTGLR